MNTDTYYLLIVVSYKLRCIDETGTYLFIVSYMLRCIDKHVHLLVHSVLYVELHR